MTVTKYHSWNSILLAFCAPSPGVPRPTFRYYLVATLRRQTNHFCSYLIQTFEPCPFLFNLWTIDNHNFSRILLARHAHALPSQNFLYATSLGSPFHSTTFDSVHILSTILRSYNSQLALYKVLICDYKVLICDLCWSVFSHPDRCEVTHARNHLWIREYTNQYGSELNGRRRIGGGRWYNS